MRFPPLLGYGCAVTSVLFSGGVFLAHLIADDVNVVDFDGTSLPLPPADFLVSFVSHSPASALWERCGKYMDVSSRS